MSLPGARCVALQTSCPGACGGAVCRDASGASVRACSALQGRPVPVAWLWFYPAWSTIPSHLPLWEQGWDFSSMPEDPPSTLKGCDREQVK